MNYRQTLGLLTLATLLSGCGTSPPRSPEDICEIFREKSDWYDAAQVTQKRWGVPIQVPFAIMYQESGYRYDAKTPRKYLLWVIPWGRVSTASGYAQAKDEVWADYQKSTGRNWALESYNPCPGVLESAPATHGYAGGFGVDLMLKDLGLAVESAVGVGACVPLGALARNLYDIHSKAGNGGLDFASVFKLFTSKSDANPAGSCP